MRWLGRMVEITWEVVAFGVAFVLAITVWGWGVLLTLALAGVLLFTCAGCAVEGEGISSGPCASEGVSVDAGIDAEGPTRGPGVADAAGSPDDAGAVPDAVVGVDAGADVARVLDVGADLAVAVDAGGASVDARNLPRRCTEGERKLGSNAKVCGMVRGRWCQEFFSEVWASLAPCIYSDRPGYIFVLAGRCADCALYGEVTP